MCKVHSWGALQAVLGGHGAPTEHFMSMRFKAQRTTLVGGGGGDGGGGGRGGGDGGGDGGGEDDGDNTAGDDASVNVASRYCSKVQ